LALENEADRAKTRFDGQLERCSDWLFAA